jgi:WD40 repeat protein
MSETEAIWTCQLSKECKDLTRHPTPEKTANDIELSKDGQLLIALDAIGGRLQARLFDTSPWQERQDKALETSDSILAQSLDDQTFTLCSATRLTSFITSDRSLSKASDVAFPNEVSSCQFADDDRLISVHRDRTLRVWDRAHTLIAMARARGRDPQVSLAGSTIALLEPKRIALWDIASYGRRAGVAANATLHNDGVHVLSGRRVLDLDTGTASTGAPRVTSTSTVAGAISPSRRLSAFWDRKVGIGGYALEVSVFETSETGSDVERWRRPYQQTASRGSRMFGSTLLMVARPQLSISPDDRFVSVAIARPAEVSVFDAADGSHLLRKVDATQPLFVPGRDEVLFRVREDAGVRLAVQPLPKGQIRTLALPDGLRGDQLGAVAFSADGMHFAAAEAATENNDGAAEKRAWNVRVWDWPALTLRATLAHTAPVTSLDFSSDSTHVLASAESTKTIHVWSLATATEIARVPNSSGGGRPISMAMTPSRRLAFSDSVGLTVLPIDVQQWIQEGCARISRNLSREEWEILFGNNVDYAMTCQPRTR